MNKAEKLKKQIIKERERFKEYKRKKEEKEEALRLKKELELQRKELKIEKPKYTLGGWKDMFKKMNKDKLLIVNMELLNGMHTTFYINQKDNSFKYNDKRFIFDEKLKYYNTKFKTFCIDYHEGFSLPIRREFPLNDTNIAISESKAIETEYATNPTTLERFMNSSIIEMMLRGGAIDQMIRILLIVCMITGVLSLANLLLFMYAQGYFNNLG